MSGMAERATKLMCGGVALALHGAAAFGLYHGSETLPEPIPQPTVLSARWEAPPAPVEKPAPPALVPTPVPVKPEPKVEPLTPPPPKPPKPVKPIKQPKPKVQKLASTSTQPHRELAQVESKAPVAAKPAPVTPVAAASAPAKTSASGTSAPIGRSAALNNPEPGYPPASRRLGEEGKVVLRVQVSADGEPLEVDVATSSGFRRLDIEARRTIARWRFIPAKKDGKPIPGSANVTIIFKLRK